MPQIEKVCDKWIEKKEDAAPFVLSAQQHPEIVVQQPILRIELPTRLGKGLQPVAIGPASDRRREAEGLVEQRHAAAVAAELIIGLEEWLPARIAGRHQIDRHD